MSEKHPHQPPNTPLPKTQHVPFDSNTFQSKDGVKSVHLNQLLIPARQPRRYFDKTEIEQLAASIKENGILQPLLVRPVGDKYEVVAGGRRYRAALQVGLTEIPVTVRVMTDTEAAQYALVENLQRSDLNPVEETEGILAMLELSLKADRARVISLLNQTANQKRGLTDNVIRTEDWETILSVFQSLGRFSPESFRTNRLPLLNLPPEILEALRQGRIEYTKAKAIAKLKEESARKSLLEEAIAQSLSLSQIKERIKSQGLAPSRRDLQGRIEAISKKIKQLKAWDDDPDKRPRLEVLLQQMESLLSEEEK